MAERPEEDPVLVDEEGPMSTDDDDEEDYDEDEELDTEEEAENVSLTSILAQLVGGGRVQAAPLKAGRPRFRRLRDVVQLPLQHPADVVHNILLNSTALNKRRRCDAPSLDSGRDPSNLRIRYHGPRVHSQPHADPSLQDTLGPALSCQALPSTGRLSSVLSLLLGSEPAAPDSGTPAVPVPDSPAVTAMLWPSGPDACQLHCSPPSPAPPATTTCNRSPFAAAAATTGAAPSQATTTPASDQPRRLRSATAREAEQQQQQNPPAAEEAAPSNSSGVSDLAISNSRRILGSIMRRLSGSRNTEGSSGGAGEATRRASQESVKAVAEEPKSEEPEVTRREDAPWSGVTQVNTAKLLAKRELGLGDVTRLSRSQQIHLQTQQNALPLEPTLLVDQHEARCYIGQFSRDGTYFVAAYQDQRVHVYEVRERGLWRLRKDVRPRNVRWTITDTCTSPDQQFLIYCSIHPTVHLVNLGSSSGPVESLANITEVHESLSFDEEQHMAERFGIWSVRWSRTGHDLIAGTNNDSVYVYDMGESKVVARARGHNDDVNAVEYLDDSPNHILTGSDDTLIKLWDRRQLDGGRRQARAAGVFVGHTEGLTHLNTKGDGNCFISNSKDQTIKMWDVRYGMRTENQAVGLRNTATNYSWDYRWMLYPGRGLDIKHPHDGSVMTYRGHEVHQTLIRAYFSPAATTGQRFIYSGSADNSVHVWDVITGHEVAQLNSHKQLVRDVSWHPSLPMIASVSWDGDVIAWTPTPAMGRRVGGMMQGTQGVAIGARRRAHWS